MTVAASTVSVDPIDSPRTPWLTAVMTEPQWMEAAAAHRRRLLPALEAREAIRARHGKDPISDFLFEYFSLRTSRLVQWTPPPGALLLGSEAPRFLDLEGCRRVGEGVALDPTTFPERRRRSARWIRDLLALTAARAPNFGCHGMHEWAMVYRVDEVRHRQVPLRVEPNALEEFVERSTICCSHWDAFRFFTPAAAPLNRLQPTRDGVVELEQPACVHANMDLYKWAYKMRPFVAAELVADAFLLAVEARRLDMEASPYDLRAYGLEPIPVETEEGRATYRARQRAVSELAAPIRARLIDAYDWILAHAPEAPCPPSPSA